MSERRIQRNKSTSPWPIHLLKTISQLIVATDAKQASDVNNTVPTESIFKSSVLPKQTDVEQVAETAGMRLTVSTKP